jgi:hypothetical protein
LVLLSVRHRRLEPFSQSVTVFVTHVVIHKGRSCFGWLVRNSLLACELGSSGNHCPSVREIALWVFFGEVGMPTLGDVPLLVWLGTGAAALVISISHQFLESCSAGRIALELVLDV